MRLNYVQTSGQDVANIVDSIEDVVEGIPNILVTTACLVVAVLAQNPEISPERLQDVVKGLSEYIAVSVFDVKES